MKPLHLKVTWLSQEGEEEEVYRSLERTGLIVPQTREDGAKIRGKLT